METIKANICEDPIYVFISLAVAVLVMLVLWHSNRKTLYLQLIIVPVILAGVVFAMDYYIITDREQIDQAVLAIVTDLEAGKLDAADYYLDDKFAGYKINKILLLKFAQAQLDKLQIENINLSHDTVTITGKQADMTVTSVLDLGGKFKGKYALKWQLHWVKRPQGWRIDEVAPPEQTIPGF